MSEILTAKKYFRAKEACSYLGISQATIWRWAKNGILKSYKLSEGVTVFKKDDMDGLVATKSDDLI